MTLTKTNVFVLSVTSRTTKSISWLRQTLQRVVLTFQVSLTSTTTIFHKIQKATFTVLDVQAVQANQFLIINGQILPRFKAGDIPGGIAAGTDALITQLTLPPDQAQAAHDLAHRLADTLRQRPDVWAAEREVLAARAEHDVRLPLLLMDSFNTQQDTLAALAAAQGGTQHTVQAVHTGQSPNGRGYTRTVYARPAEPTGAVVAEHWLLHHTGHAWAGGHASGSHTDPAAVRKIAHHGHHYQVEGVNLTAPSLQRTPVIYQAGTSDRGKAFAARHPARRRHKHRVVRV